MRKDEVLIPSIEINSKWVIDLHVKAKTINTLRSQQKCQSWIGQWILRYDSKSTAIKEKTD